MAYDGRLTSVVNLCREPLPAREAHEYLTGDESRAGVLAYRWLACYLPNATLKFALGSFRKRRVPNKSRRIPDELPPSFPPCHGRIGPGGRDFAKLRYRAGTIADALCTRRLGTGLPDTCPKSVSQPDRYAAGSRNNTSASLLAHPRGLGYSDAPVG